MNMQVHGDGSSGIFMHHGLTDVPGRIEKGNFAVCLTNPPFGSVENDAAVLKEYELGSGRKSQDRLTLAVERAVDLVKPGGRIGIIVIDGILNNDRTRYVRDYLRRHTWVKAVVSLNSETFEGYGARAKTSVLFLEKKQSPDQGEQRPVFMAIAKNTGYAPNGAQISGNELPDLLLAYKAFLRGDHAQNPNLDAWISECQDRLDAEFYWNKQDRAIRDVASIQENVGELLADVNREYAHLLSELNAAYENQDFHTVTLGELLEEAQQREKVEPDQDYRLIGVRWWGGGVFIREEKPGREIKGTHLCRVSPDHIIYNRLFAFRGSFAIVGQEHEGCHASSEFPTFRMKPLVAHPAEKSQYIVHCLNSPNYLRVVDKLSTGSTKQSRNRFKEDRFLNMQVELPSLETVLTQMVEMLNRADLLRNRQQSLLDSVKELREGIGRLLPFPKGVEA